MPSHTATHVRAGLLTALLSLAATVAQALPQHGVIAAGRAVLTQSATTLTIRQSSPGLVLDWQGFDIDAGETVRLQQPSRDAIALIRIHDASPSQLRGRLQANGQIWLINQHGVVFAPGSEAVAGGLMASTLAGIGAALPVSELRLRSEGSGYIVNAGHLVAADDGYVVLLGAVLENRGTVIAPRGSVALAAGSEIALAFTGAGLRDLAITNSRADERAENSGVLSADGGRVILAAGADASALPSIVRNSGRLEARAVAHRTGHIIVRGGMTAGRAEIDGRLDASAPAGGRGGRVDTDAAQLRLADGVRVTTAGQDGFGRWRIDPQDYTVAASGGDISGAALSANLATTNVVIESSAGQSAGSGNVNINDAISWSADTTLTLTAANNVNINASLSASGAKAGLVLNPATANGKDAASGNGRYVLKPGAAISLTGASPTLAIAGVNYVVINALGTAADVSTVPATPTLQGMAAQTNLGNNYALGSDLDASATSTWNDGAGFTPAGVDQNENPFTGNFEGLGHVIRNLAINRPGSVFTGLFGFSSGTLSNVGLVGGNVSGGHITGMLAGCAGGNIANSYATGTVSGGTQVGGLAGCSNGTIADSYATGNVSGDYWVGGLVGSGLYVVNSRASGNVTASTKIAGGLVGMSNGTVTGSIATGAVSSPLMAGGLVGDNNDGISTSHATGAVSGGRYLGGLAGANSNFIQSSYASGNVSGSGDHVGGLVGINEASLGAGFSAGSIANSYMLGNVTAANCMIVGGLAGRSFGTISNSYMAGSVSITNGGSGSQCSAGMVVGLNGMGGSVSNAYWNSGKAGRLPAIGYGSGTVSGLAGLSASQMRTAASFHGFTFTTTPGAGGNNWVLIDVDGSLNNAGGVAGATLPMLASEYAPAIVDAHQLQLVAMAPATSYGLARDVDASATGNGSDVWGGAGFVPLPGFAGQFDGAGFRVSGLTIKSAQSANIGLFATTAATAVVQNLRLAQLVVASPKAKYVGGLVGVNNGTVRNSCVSGSVTGDSQVGGLAGSSKGGIGTSCALGSVKGSSPVGGLVGVQMGSLARSYAAASVSGSSTTGGLVGYHSTNRDISDSYATGSVDGGYQSGGLVGENDGRISRSYSTGVVQGYQSVGGLVGAGASYPVTNSFWDTTTSQRFSSTGGRGMPTSAMQQQANFTTATPANGNVNPGWDFTGIWIMPAGGGYPLLRQVSPAP